jgi:hypothetical protein
MTSESPNTAIIALMSVDWKYRNFNRSVSSNIKNPNTALSCYVGASNQRVTTQLRSRYFWPRASAPAAFGDCQLQSDCALCRAHPDGSTAPVLEGVLPSGSGVIFAGGRVSALSPSAVRFGRATGYSSRQCQLHLATRFKRWQVTKWLSDSLQPRF